MTLDITFDPEAEEINMVLDNHMVITAYKDTTEEIVYNKAMQKIDDDALYNTIRDICKLLFKLSA